MRVTFACLGWLRRVFGVSSDRTPLAALTSERPRLMATAAAIATMRNVLRQDQTAADWQKKVVAQADQLLTLPPLAPTSAHYPGELAAAPLTRPLQTGPESGAPLSALDIARLFVLRIQTLGVVWFATEDDRYRDCAKQELLAMCDFPDWKGDEFLVTAETTFGAAIGYDWLHNALSVDERRRIAGAILEKGVKPGFKEFTEDPPPHWTRTASNWNLVCNGALMIAAMAIAEADRFEAKRIFDLCRQSVVVGFGMYRPDGGWAEGPGYWHYATQYAVYLIDSLGTALGGDLGLGRSVGFGGTGLFRLHIAGTSGKLFNFADSEEQHSGGYWLFWLAKRYHHPVDAWVEQQHAHGKVHPMDLLWFDPDAPWASSGRLRAGHRFEGIDVAILRGDWRDADAPYLGVKGGANNASHHSHYDLGSFVLDAGGVRWAMDLGPDDYHLPDYFTPEKRSQYYRTSTLGHNTLVVEGQSQPATARAKILAVRFDPDLSFVVLDMGEACPSCSSACRGFALIDGRDAVIVDEIAPELPIGNVTWQMHTEAVIALRGPAATLTQTTTATRSRELFLRIVEPAGLAFASAPATPSGPPGQNPNNGVARLTIDLGRVGRPVRLVVLLLPKEPDTHPFVLPPILARSLNEWGDERRT